MHAASIFFDADNGDRVVRFTHEVATRFGMDQAAIDQLVESVQQPLDDMASILSVDVPAGMSYERILEDARMQVLALSLDAMLDLASSEVQVAEYARRASTDALTGLPNRAQLDIFLGRQIDLRIDAPRAESLGLLMIDLDHFKSVNDVHGHVIGDVLRSMGETLAATTRDSDLLCRYGGEEFCLVLPQTSPTRMRGIAERLRREIATIVVPDGSGGMLHVTASIGGACVERCSHPDDARRLVERADRNLYDAKRRGRDCCVVCPEDGCEPG